MGGGAWAATLVEDPAALSAGLGWDSVRDVAAEVWGKSDAVEVFAVFGAEAGIMEQLLC